MSMKNSDDFIGNRTRDLPACSAVPQLTALPRAPNVSNIIGKKYFQNTMIYGEMIYSKMC